VRRTLLVTQIAALLVVPIAAFADKADRDKPTQIEANRLSADDTRRLTIFEGAVVLTRGTIRLTAERLVVRQDAEGYQFATATGKPARFRQRQDPKPPDTEGTWIEGEALRMEMDDRSGKIELFDNARVNRGGDEVAGNYIFVDQRSDFFSVSAGKGPGASDGRVRAILQPKAPTAEAGK
jgi:lipopolysaccharide export system protein LptA